MAVPPRLALLDPDQRLAGSHQVLLVGEGLACMLLAEEIEVGATDCLCGILKPEPVCESPTDADKPALVVLEVDMVGRVLEECVQEVTIVDELLGTHPDRCLIEGIGRRVVH